jgi:hypothetical protein
MSANVTHLADNILPVTRGSILTVDLSAGAVVVVDLEDASNRPAAPLAGSGDTDAAKTFWSGCYASLQAIGGAVFFYFADDAVPTLINAPTPGISPRSGVRINDGETVDQLLPIAPITSSQGGAPPPVWKRRYLHAIKAAGAGPTFLTLWPSSTKAM